MEKQEIVYAFKTDETVDCRIAEGWDQSGKKGQYFGYIYVSGRKWAIVQFENENDPDMHKAEGIEILYNVWKNVKTL